MTFLNDTQHTKVLSAERLGFGVLSTQHCLLHYSLLPQHHQFFSAQASIPRKFPRVLTQHGTASNVPGVIGHAEVGPGCVTQPAWDDRPQQKTRGPENADLSGHPRDIHGGCTPERCARSMSSCFVRSSSQGKRGRRTRLMPTFIRAAAVANFGFVSKSGRSSMCARLGHHSLSHGYRHSHPDRDKCRRQHPCGPEPWRWMIRRRRRRPREGGAAIDGTHGFRRGRRRCCWPIPWSWLRRRRPTSPSPPSCHHDTA